MQGATRGRLRNLLAAAEAVGHDYRVPSTCQRLPRVRAFAMYMS